MTFCPEGCYWDCEHRRRSAPEGVQAMIDNARQTLDREGVGDVVHRLLYGQRVYVYKEEPPSIRYSRDALILVPREDGA